MLLMVLSGSDKDINKPASSLQSTFNCLSSFIGRKCYRRACHRNPRLFHALLLEREMHVLRPCPSQGTVLCFPIRMHPLAYFLQQLIRHPSTHADCS